MPAMSRFFVRLLKEEDGPTAVEYAVMLALILVAIVGAIGAVGFQTGGMWGNNSTQLIDAGLGS
jgi:pilus assembly protein Flp/PilA